MRHAGTGNARRAGRSKAGARKRSRRPNPRLIKCHRNYSVEEVARLLDLHRNTVRQWIKLGLPVCDGRKPTLILGRDLIAFVQARRSGSKRPCQRGEIFCMRCRVPRRPAGDMVDCEALTDRVGNLIGICPVCDALMYRKVSLARLDEVRGQLDVCMAKAASRIGESTNPFVKCDLEAMGDNPRETA